MGQRTSKAEVLVHLGRNIRKRRERLRLSQERLGFKSHLHPTYISSVERGERNLALINILRIASALGTTPGRMLRGLQHLSMPPGYKRNP